jgi:hypothetical protein
MISKSSPTIPHSHLSAGKRLLAASMVAAYLPHATRPAITRSGFFRSTKVLCATRKEGIMSFIDGH